MFGYKIDLQKTPKKAPSFMSGMNLGSQETVLYMLNFKPTGRRGLPSHA